MDMFERATRVAKDVGETVFNSAKSFGTNFYNSTKEQSELGGLNVQKSAIERKLNDSYALIGKKYVEYIRQGHFSEAFNVNDIMEQINPELAKLDDIQFQIDEKEQEIKKNNEERALKKAQDEFEIEKSKLDRALEMDIITKLEYEEKVSAAQKKLDNYDILRKIQMQFEMGIITREEYNEKVNGILG